MKKINLKYFRPILNDSKNKNILITGAGKGIGESTVKKIIEKEGYAYIIIKNKKDNKKFSKSKNIKIYNGNVNNKKLIQRIFKDL